MPSYIATSLETLVDGALEAMYRAAERPTRLIVGANALTSDSDTQFTLDPGPILAVSDLVETQSGELMLVTARSSDTPPVYTVIRGYLGTEKDASVATGTAMLKNPAWSRAEVTRWVQRAVAGPMNTELPYVEVMELDPHSQFKYVELPSDALDVVRVRYFSEVTGDLADLGGWAFEEVPATVAASKKILRLRPSADSTLILDVVRPYSFSGTGEAATVSLPLAGQDIPILWACAYGLSRREVSRSELDKVEEWNQEQAIRAGVNLRLVRDAWGEVYRRIDETKRVHKIARHRPFRKMPKVW